MSFSAQDIAAAVKGVVEGNPDARIDDAAGLDEARANHLSFFHNVKYVKSLEQTQAAIILVPAKNDFRLPPGKTFVKVANPQWAFAQVLTLLQRGRSVHPTGISPQAAIDPTASVGKNAAIGAFAVIGPGAAIGENAIIYAGCYIGARSVVGANTILYPHVVLREDVSIGERGVIHSGAVLGADGYGFATVDGRHQKIPQIGRVVVGDDVEIGANVTIDRATTGETRIGAGTKIDNLVHIAHNVHIGRDCLIVAQVGVSGSTKIGDRVTLAGQVGVVGHVTIGDGAIVTAQSGIMNDVDPGAILFGSPARPHREAMKLQALYGKLPEIYDAIKFLRKKGAAVND